jgi:hypothetical protein
MRSSWRCSVTSPGHEAFRQMRVPSSERIVGPAQTVQGALMASPLRGWSGNGSEGEPDSPLPLAAIRSRSRLTAGDVRVVLEESFGAVLV